MIDAYCYAWCKSNTIVHIYDVSIVNYLVTIVSYNRFSFNIIVNDFNVEFQS